MNEVAAVAAPRTTDSQSRDRRLARAAGAFLFSLVFASLSAVLVLVSFITTHQLVGFWVVAMLALVAVLIQFPGIWLSRVAFARTGVGRSKQLELGANWIALSALAALIAAVVATGVSIANQLPRIDVAAHGSGVLGGCAVVGAALAASKGFSAAGVPGAIAVASRDRWLAMASAALAGSYLVAALSAILDTAYLARWKLTSAYALWASVGVLGTLCAAGAGAIATLAFHKSQRRQRRGELDWRRRRDSLLAVAASVFAAAFLVLASASIGAASLGRATVQGKAFPSLIIAASWLTAFESIGLAVACLIARSGFSRSRNAQLLGEEPRSA